MANMIYVSITGKNQGLISAGCSTFDSIGNRYQSGHKDQIMVHSFEHTISRDLKVKHGPISFIKPLDKSSPLIGVPFRMMKNWILRLMFTGHQRRVLINFTIR